ncbi:MAG: glucoamylase family protein [Bacteroides sp.]
MKRFNYLSLALMFLFVGLCGCKGENTKLNEDVSFIPDEDYRKDRELLEKLQRETFEYMWFNAHPTSGMVYERNTGVDTPVTVGGTGFGIAAIVVAVQNGWITRDEALQRLLLLTNFLFTKTERQSLHGAFPHWMNGQTGATIAFSPKDDGADIVETSFLIEGLLIARAYFSGTGDEAILRKRISDIWKGVDWQWFTKGENNGLYWHWSPTHGFEMNMKIAGFNECMVTYILAVSSPTHPISRAAYNYWTSTSGYQTKTYNGYTIQASMPYTGPLFFVHYSFIGLDPREMADSFVPGGYWVRNVTQTLINRAYCLETAPKANLYSPQYWGLTASDIRGGYTASAPDNDKATVAPTAALSSMPYTPEYSMQVLWNLYLNYRAQMWGTYGPYDAMSLRESWFATSYLAIDQLPIVCMIENYRSGLLWTLFKSDTDIGSGLRVAGISPPIFTPGFPEMVVTLKLTATGYVPDACDLRRHPDTGLYTVRYYVEHPGSVTFSIVDTNGFTLRSHSVDASSGVSKFSFPQFMKPNDNVYVLVMATGEKMYRLPIRMK